MRFVCYTMARFFSHSKLWKFWLICLTPKNAVLPKEAFIEDLSKDWPGLHGAGEHCKLL